MSQNIIRQTYKNIPYIFDYDYVKSDWDDEWLFFDDDKDLINEEERLNKEKELFINRPPQQSYKQIHRPNYKKEFPGAVERDWETFQPPTDALAFYLPFHYFYPEWWGIYIIKEGLDILKRNLVEVSNYDDRLCYKAARSFLYFHEFYHHRIESFVTRLEITHRKKIYIDGLLNYKIKFKGTEKYYEETLANTYAYMKTIKQLKKESEKKRGIKKALKVFIKNQPVPYCNAIKLINNKNLDKQFEILQNRYLEIIHQYSLTGIPSINEDIWNSAPHLTRGISQVNSITRYIIHQKDPIAKRILDKGEYLKYSQLCKKLRKVFGCRKSDRKGKGSHEWWINKDGKEFYIPRHPGDIKRGTVRKIIRDMGEDLSVKNFLATSK